MPLMRCMMLSIRRSVCSSERTLPVTMKATSPGLTWAAVMDEDLHLERRVEAVEHLAGNLHAREHALLLDEELALAHRLLGDAAKGGVVAVANILGKGQIDQSLFQFFYTQHILFFF